MNTFAAALLSIVSLIFVTSVALAGVLSLAPYGETLGVFAPLSLMLGFAAGLLVFRGIKGRISHNAIFHVCFFTGLASLTGCLCVALKTVKTAASAIVAVEPVYTVQFRIVGFDGGYRLPVLYPFVAAAADFLRRLRPDSRRPLEEA